MDKLFESASAFNRLLDFEYRFIIGRKGKTSELKIGFCEKEFHHIIGLQYLTDIPNVKRNRTHIFDEILKGNITYEKICKSVFINKIDERILMSLYLEQLFDSNELIFKYNEKSNSFSLIQAEYLLQSSLNGQEIYIFIDKRTEDNNQYFCRSFFPKSNKDYSKNQTKYTLLYKEKINIKTGESIVQYDRISPKM